MPHYTHLIWDFNGTLFDDVDACIQSANALLGSHGLPPISSPDAYRAIFGFPIIDYYRRMGFDFSVTPYEELAVEWVEFYNRYSKNSGLYPSVPALLSATKEAGIPQILLSATQEEMLRGQLRTLGIESFFDEILGLDNIHAYSKTELARRWKEVHSFAHPLYIGDTDHDAETARAMGADFILLASGHQPKNVLENCHPSAILNCPDDLFRNPIFSSLLRQTKTSEP